MKNSGLKLSLQKYSFFQNKIEYLGYVIDKVGLHTSNFKTAAIQQATKSTNVSQLKSFLGLVNYYGKFVKNLAMVLHPLYNLQKKDVVWKWDAECEQVFNKIKVDNY